MQIIEVPLMVKKVLTKQPRKKNNRRWVKKYWKKYSTTVPKKDVLVSELTGQVFCHPSVAVELRREFSNSGIHADNQHMLGLGLGRALGCW